MLISSDEGLFRKPTVNGWDIKPYPVQGMIIPGTDDGEVLSGNEKGFRKIRPGLSAILFVSAD
jgi:hypothetical protein